MAIREGECIEIDGDGLRYTGRAETVTTPGGVERLRAEVAELRRRNAELADQRLELDERAYYDGRVAELEAMLRRMEWADHLLGFDICPICRGYRQIKGHAPDCELVALLGESEG